MESIVRAEIDDLEQCVDIFFESELGQKYYPRRELLKSELKKSFAKDKIYVKKYLEDGEGSGAEVVGVVWYQLEGMFHAFPYLHMIAVKKGHRDKGIGTELIDFFEQDVLVNGRNHLRAKVFLTVADFNEAAEALYLRRGYSKFGEVENLFRKGVTEKLMMKIVTADK